MRIISACAAVILGLMPLATSVPQRADAAVTGPIHVVITDRGFSPQQLIAVVNRPLNLQVLNKGRKVHQFSIPYYYVFTETLQPGQTSTVGFTPNTAGRFEMTSDPMGTNTPEFKALLIVTDHK